MNQTNRVIIVTGSGRGIGRAIAHRFGQNGDKVALVSRTESQLQTVAGEIEAAGGTALALPTDVTDHAAVKAMVERVEAELGPVDVLVSNAASFYALGPVWEVDPAQWWTDVTINIQGVFLCAHVVVAGMVERGAGRVINLIGGGTDRPFPYGSGYASSKAAVMRLTETLAAEAKDHGISVFAMGPGLVRTALTEYQLESEAGQRYFGQIGQRFAEGKDVPPTMAANLAFRLASGDFDALSGRAFSVNDDLEAILGQVDEIIAGDWQTLRMRRG